MNQTKKWLDDNNIAYTVGEDGLVYVDGKITILENSNITLEHLAEVSEYIWLRTNTTFIAPVLLKSGLIYVSKNATFIAPVLLKSGSVFVGDNATLNAPILAEVSGSFYMGDNATFTAPALLAIKDLKGS